LNNATRANVKIVVTRAIMKIVEYDIQLSCDIHNTVTKAMTVRDVAQRDERSEFELAPQIGAIGDRLCGRAERGAYILADQMGIVGVKLRK